MRVISLLFVVVLSVALTVLMFGISPVLGVVFALFDALTAVTLMAAFVALVRADRKGRARRANNVLSFVR